MKAEIEVKCKNAVDKLCGLFINQLLEFNKAGRYAHSMTNLLLERKLTVDTYGEKGLVTQSVFRHLFSMTQFKKTAERVSDLCITMFPLEGFREKVT